jgi:hypothetical protein
VRTTLKKRVSRQIGQLRRALHVDTQHTRKKLVRRLEEVFETASDYARGKIKRVTDEDGKERPLTIVERQFWARIAAYTAQIINNVAKGIDERKIDHDLDNLARMLNEGKAEEEAARTREATGTTAAKRTNAGRGADSADRAS